MPVFNCFANSKRILIECKVGKYTMWSPNSDLKKKKS